MVISEAKRTVRKAAAAAAGWPVHRTVSVGNALVARAAAVHQRRALERTVWVHVHRPAVLTDPESQSEVN